MTAPPRTYGGGGRGRGVRPFRPGTPPDFPLTPVFISHFFTAHPPPPPLPFLPPPTLGRGGDRLRRVAAPDGTRPDTAVARLLHRHQLEDWLHRNQIVGEHL